MEQLLDNIEELWSDELSGPRDIESKFGDSIGSIGLVAFLVFLFCHRSSGRLNSVLAATAFVWKDLTFEQYVDLFWKVVPDYAACFDFIVFSERILGIETRRLVTQLEEDGKPTPNHLKEFLPQSDQNLDKSLAKLWLQGNEEDLWSRLRKK